MTIINVQMGEGVVASAPDVITTMGCGSCVILALYDAGRKVGGLAHVMLPEYVPTALPALLDEMRKKGCNRRDIVARIAGGARMFSCYAEFQAGIGEQNVKRMKQSLEMEGIPLAGWDTGGQHGRSVEFYLDSGRVVVKAFGRADKEI